MSSSSDSPVTLYSYWRSSCSWRVRIALNLKGIPYTYYPVNLLKGEHTAETYRLLNPSCTVPALSIDGALLTQSLAILEYIEETRPEGAALLPKDPVARAAARAISLMVVADIQPVQNMRVLNKAAALGADKNQWAKEVIESGFVQLEEHLARGKRQRFAVSEDSPTIADLAIVPQVYNAKRFGVDMEKFPNIARIANECAKLEAFSKAEPDNQPDAVKN